jgi:hypothetical protein
LTQAQLAAEAAGSTTWGSLVDTQLARRCRTWGIDPIAEVSSIAVSDTPVLVLRANLHRSSTDQWVSGLALLSNRVEAVFPNEGFASNFSGNGCAAELRLRFLQDPLAPLDVEPCTSQDPPIAFIE